MIPRFFRWSYLIWAFVPLGLWLFTAIFGLPHVIWERSYNAIRTDGSRYYIACTYIGSAGEITRPAHNGRCFWIAFSKKEVD